MFKSQTQGLRPRTPKSLRAADLRHRPWLRTPLRKTPEPPWSVLLCLLVFSGDVERAGGTPAAEEPSSLSVPVSSGGEAAGRDAGGKVWHGGSVGVRGVPPPRLRFENKRIAST